MTPIGFNGIKELIEHSNFINSYMSDCLKVQKLTLKLVQG